MSSSEPMLAEERCANASVLDVLLDLEGISSLFIVVIPQIVAFAAVPPARYQLTLLLGMLSLVGDAMLAMAFAWGRVGAATLDARGWSRLERRILFVASFAAVALMHAAVFLMHRASYRLMRERVRRVEGGLPNVLRQGHMRLLSVRWLMQQPADFRLPMRQELELMDGALVTEAAAVRLLRQGKVAALSYRWLERHTSECVPACASMRHPRPSLCLRPRATPCRGHSRTNGWCMHERSVRIRAPLCTCPHTPRRKHTRGSAPSEHA